MRRCFSLILLFACFAGSAFGEEHSASKVAHTPQWEKLKSLAGEWDGSVQLGDKQVPTHVSIRMTGDDSAIMHWMDAGTPHEMVTIFHPDGNDLMVTHYCSAHNQPRMRLVSGPDANKLAFDFKDGTNIAPGDGYMHGVAIIFLDADHHDEEWSYDQGNGKLRSTVFHYTRAATAAKP